MSSERMTTTAHTLTEGTLILNGRNGLGRVIRASRNGGAAGYDVLAATGDPGSRGGATVFSPDWCTKPAVIGDTVCPEPWGECWCGLSHFTPEVLSWLPKAEAGP